jgi:hypothetical protein
MSWICSTLEKSTELVCCWSARLKAAASKTWSQVTKTSATLGVINNNTNRNLAPKVPSESLTHHQTDSESDSLSRSRRLESRVSSLDSRGPSGFVQYFPMFFPVRAAASPPPHSSFRMKPPPTIALLGHQSLLHAMQAVNDVMILPERHSGASCRCCAALLLHAAVPTHAYRANRRTYCK